MPEASQRQGTPWPFMVAPTHHDMRVSPQGVVVPGRQEVEFKDGKRLWLSRVMGHGVPDCFLRYLGEPADGLRVDLRHHIPDVAQELPTTSARDVAVYVAMSLRQRYATRDEFVSAAIGRSTDK